MKATTTITRPAATKISSLGSSSYCSKNQRTRKAITAWEWNARLLTVLTNVERTACSEEGMGWREGKLWPSSIIGQKKTKAPGAFKGQRAAKTTMRKNDYLWRSMTSVPSKFLLSDWRFGNRGLMTSTVSTILQSILFWLQQLQKKYHWGGMNEKQSQHAPTFSELRHVKTVGAVMYETSCRWGQHGSL